MSPLTARIVLHMSNKELASENYKRQYQTKDKILVTSQKKWEYQCSCAGEVLKKFCNNLDSYFQEI